MNKNTGIIIGAVGLVVIAIGVYASMNSKSDDMMLKSTDGSEVMEKESEAMVKDEAAKDGVSEEKKMTTEEVDMKKDDMVKEDAIMKKAGVYETYTADKVMRAETGDVVLFFHASWCPSCRGLNADIESNMGAIPEGLSILKVDYDKEVELKKKYGVTTQHTLVQVDKDGNLIKKWSGGSKLSNLVSEIE